MRRSLGMDNVSGAHPCAQSCSSRIMHTATYHPVSPCHISLSRAIALTVGYDLRARRTCARSAWHCSQMVCGAGIHGSHKRLEHGVCHPHDLAQDRTRGGITLQKYLTVSKNTRGSGAGHTYCERSRHPSRRARSRNAAGAPIAARRVRYSAVQRPARSRMTSGGGSARAPSQAQVKSAMCGG